MTIVWLALAVFGFALLLLIFLAIFFPHDLKELMGRTGEVEIRPTRFALKFYEKAVEEKEHQPVPRETAKATLESIAGGAILWVDDAPGNNRLEVRALTARGVEVDQAVTNEEAVALASEAKYDLILSDIRRNSSTEPEMAGLDLPARMREAGVNRPIAFYVGCAERASTPNGEPVFDRPSELFDFLSEQLRADPDGARE